MHAKNHSRTNIKNNRIAQTAGGEAFVLGDEMASMRAAHAAGRDAHARDIMPRMACRRDAWRM